MASKVETKSLASWLKSHQLIQLLPILQNEIEELDDFKMLTNETEVIEFVVELNITSAQKSQLKAAILEFTEIASMQSRIIFPDGINLIPFTRKEYKLWAGHNCMFAKGQGFAKDAISIKTTKRKTANGKLRKVKQGEIQKLCADDKHKIILMCGKTGAGKSTLINSMMNYIYNVQFDDKFRLKLIEEQKKSGGDADSCTDHISSYRIKAPKGGNINYDLTIIDAPGFCDSRGIYKDMQIIEEYKWMFNNLLSNVNAICFVLNSTSNRLDASQIYVFNQILNLWGKDMLDNIFILMTFADSRASNCTDALNKNSILRNCQHRYKINNSAFMENPINKQPDGFDEAFWKMGFKCFDQFFDGLNKVKPANINLSTNVLKQRDNIQNKINKITECMENKLKITQQIEQAKNEIDRTMKEMNVIPEQVWYEYEYFTVQKPSSIPYVTTCIRHNKSCHPTCPRSDKRQCSVMNSDGYCTVCSCPASDHVNRNYIITMEKRTVRKSNWDNSSLRDRYNNAKNVLSELEQKLNSLKTQLNEIEMDIANRTRKVESLNNELKKIALKPQLITLGDYIEQLMEIEKDAQNRDFEKMNTYKKLKMQENLMMSIDEKQKH